MSKKNRNNIILTLACLVGLMLLTLVSVEKNFIFIFAASVGGIGGLLHEIAQSGGKIFLPRSEKDGLYLGAFSGIVLGAVSGFLLLKGVIDLETLPSENINYFTVGYETFVAGLGLKGLSEALGTKVKEEETQPANPT